MTLRIDFSGKEREEKSLPRSLHEASRSGTSVDADPLIDQVVKVKRSFEVFPKTRGDAADEHAEAEDDEIVALEAEDGTTLFISARQLLEDARLIRPESVQDGRLDLAKFVHPDQITRGGFDTLWRALHILELTPDSLIGLAKEQAAELARKVLGKAVEDAAYGAGSYFAVKGLMSVIESQLAGEEGLYLWRNASELRPADLHRQNDPRLLEAARKGEAGRILVLIHGTASSTLGSFEGLREAMGIWGDLTSYFEGGIFGFEHRTFSKSPIENALELVRALPAGARVSLVTHSRGGLIGDLVCLDALEPADIEGFVHGVSKKADVSKQRDIVQAAQAERDLLFALQAEKVAKNIHFERYVRVACPARGTRLLSDNLPVFLSGLLTFVQKAGATAASALATPVAGATTSTLLGVVKRVVLEIIKRRLNPLLVPGIAAMSAHSPLAAFLEKARRDKNVSVAVVAGDTEFDRIELKIKPFFHLIANLFADWALFDQVPNDFVVDTQSMYGGLGADSSARYLYDQDSSVSHFRYFKNPLTRDALQQWLFAKQLEDVKQFALGTDKPVPWSRRLRSAARGDTTDRRPFVVLVPDFMGSSLSVASPSSDVPGRRLFLDGGRLEFSSQELSTRENASIVASDLFELRYGRLADHLESTHRVVRFAYDWRLPIRDNANRLRQRLEQLTDQPINILAHGVGGLVVRCLMTNDTAQWSSLIRNGRVVMLGTPQHGTASIVYALLGKTALIRQLALLDPQRDLQQVIVTFASWPGALELLPEDGAAGPRSIEFWTRANQCVRDRFYGDKVCWLGDEAKLAQARDFWAELPNPARVERIACVHGQSPETPFRVEFPTADAAALKLSFTREGDGMVTWESSRWSAVPPARHYLMPVEHADLVDSPEHFAALVELLERGETARLSQLDSRAAVRGDATFFREAEPVIYPNLDDLLRAALSSKPRRLSSTRTMQPLRVAVRADNVLNAQAFVLCGHYSGDAIAGVEARLDEMLDGRLAERERLGLYADELGTSAIVVLPKTREQKARRQQQGAIVVGLGDLNGQLSSQSITKTVRAAVLRTLMLVHDAMEGDEVKLVSVLIGYNSSPNISIAESLAAVTHGVVEANHEFTSVFGACGKETRVTHLTFYELFLDAAISAARDLRDLPLRLESELRRARTRLAIEPTLERGNGFRHRLSASRGLGYWPRLVVTDADRNESNECPAECYEARVLSPVPRELRDRICNHDQPCDCSRETPRATGDSPAPSAGEPSPAPQAPAPKYLPARLRYVFLSQRARAESIVQQRQPGLIEAIVNQQLNSPRFNRDLSRLLFQLMVPLDFKTAAREQQNLVLVVDAFSADLPWEMLQADEEPLVVRTAMVRQLATSEFRRGVRTALRNWACVIADPLTTDYERHYGRSKLPVLDEALREGEAVRALLMKLPPLDEALREGEAVKAVLERSWQVEYVGRGQATEILAKLYERPYRILVIAAHGAFEIEARDGSRRTGIVLSHGVFLTAVEISQMEVVPEIVFLNCCFLGRQNTTPANGSPHRLAYSVSRELINMGVRCVVAAGWAVDDAAARTFSETFFDQLVERRSSFGTAVHIARQTTWTLHPNTNTWGAYQAYGDPGYRLSPDGSAYSADVVKPASLDELLDEIAERTRRLRARSGGRKKQLRTQRLSDLERWAEEQLEDCPAEWARSAEVHQALAKLFAELGEEGFERARGHYLRAISQPDENWRVAICAVEQLANLESRTAVSRWRAASARGHDESEHKKAIALASAAIERMKSLTKLAEPGPEFTGALPLPNIERWAILGGAHKRHALLLSAAKEPNWDSISAELVRARDAYAKAASSAEGVEPYPLVNRIQLDWLVDPKFEESGAQAALQELEQAKLAAARAFERTQDFFDAIVQADMATTQWLIGKADEEESEKQLLERYREFFNLVPHSARERLSVSDQLQTLASFVRRKVELSPVRQESLDATGKLIERLARAIET